MAQITPSTFNPLLTYVNVRLQQGVPIVDADWNELDDVRKFEVRSFLKWFVGDGIPQGSDGFRIVGSGLDTDFTVSAGLPTGAPLPSTDFERALGWVGRCLVDGLDVLIRQDVKFSAQPLHESQSGAVALAARLNVPVVTKLPAVPAADEVVYLDVWERPVTPDAEPSLVHAGLGVETCARVKREWVVRVLSTTSARTPGHLYYPLARLSRAAAPIGPEHVTDMREKNLLLPPATLMTDTLGIDARDYRRGSGRPPVSLRAAVNSLLRGEVPGGPEGSFPGGVSYVRSQQPLIAQPDGVITFWTADDRKLMMARAPSGGPSPVFGPPQALTAGPGLEPRAAALPGGQVAVTYLGTPNPDGTQALQLRVAKPDVLLTAPDNLVAARGFSYVAPVVALGPDLVAVVFMGTVGPWCYRRFVPSRREFLDKDPVSTGLGGTGDATGVVGSDRLWTAYISSDATKSYLTAQRTVTPAGPSFTWALEEGTVSRSVPPTVVAVSDAEGWVFASVAGILSAYRLQGDSSVKERVASGLASRVGAAVDASGTVWATWVVDSPGAAPTASVYVARRGPAGWGQPWRIGGASPGSLAEIVDTKDSMTVRWVDQGRIFAKRLFTVI